jgi:hypothetical protein
MSQSWAYQDAKKALLCPFQDTYTRTSAALALVQYGDFVTITDFINIGWAPSEVVRIAAEGTAAVIANCKTLYEYNPINLNVADWVVPIDIKLFINDTKTTFESLCQAALAVLNTRWIDEGARIHVFTSLDPWNFGASFYHHFADDFSEQDSIRQLALEKLIRIDAVDKVTEIFLNRWNPEWLRRRAFDAVLVSGLELGVCFERVSDGFESPDIREACLSFLIERSAQEELRSLLKNRFLSTWIRQACLDALLNLEESNDFLFAVADNLYEYSKITESIVIHFMRLGADNYLRRFVDGSRWRTRRLRNLIAEYFQHKHESAEPKSSGGNAPKAKNTTSTVPHFQPTNLPKRPIIPLESRERGVYGVDDSAHSAGTLRDHAGGPVRR